MASEIPDPRSARPEPSAGPGAAELERISRRLASANAGLDRERQARAAALEQASSAADELQAALSELREVRRRGSEATAERDEAIRAKARAESTLRERDIELDTASRALADERAENRRLLTRLARAQAQSPAPQRAEVSGATPDHDIERAVETPRPVRLSHPTRRRRANWAGRALVLLVMLGVIAAILLVVRATVSI